MTKEKSAVKIIEAIKPFSISKPTFVSVVINGFNDTPLFNNESMQGIIAITGKIINRLDNLNSVSLPYIETAKEIKIIIIEKNILSDFPEFSSDI
ncbi:MAG: hypothetical protein IKI97_04435 [Clostridia bacterium]|nr:hypothetical protein [Clostridia bacterium]